MINISSQIYAELDPDKKTPSWANMCITNLRRNWRPIINIERSRSNKAYLLGMQSIEQVKKSFKDKRFIANTRWEPIDVMFNIRNTLTEELLKAPPKAEVKATDPLAISDREKDITMLQSRGFIQNDVSKYNKQVGLPAYKLPYDKFKGNVREFDKMGLDDQNPDDLNFYQQGYQRLNYEIAAQLVLNNVFKTARFDEDFVKKYMIDILADNFVGSQTYVDKITGEIKVKYLYPEIARAIRNDWNDGYNDICNGWEDNITVMEFIQMVGNEFEWNRDWPELLFAINFCMNTKFTGFIRNNMQFSCLSNSELCARGGFDGSVKEDSFFDFQTLAYTYKVYVGYMEWNTCEATTTIAYNPKNPADFREVPYSYEPTDPKSKKKVKAYQKQSWYQQQWYGSYYLGTSTVSQWIFNYSKVYYQNIEGANDEYASGTIKYYQQEGKSAVEIAKPFIDFVNFTFYKLQWLVWHAKPEEDQVVIEELIAIAKGMQRLYPQSGGQNTMPTIDNILQNILKFQRENFTRLRSFPQIDGKTVQQLPMLEGRRNGIDNLSAQMLQIMGWAEAQISQKIGINAMRLGANPQSRESFKSEQATLQASVNTTGYLYRIIQFLKERISTCVLLYSQDIINYEDSIPYKWLKTIMGNEMFDALQTLGNVAAHRFGIFVRDYNSDIDRQNIQQAANIALTEKMITFDGWFIVTQSEDPKRASQYLAYMQLKGAKRARAQQIQDMKIQDNMAQNAFLREQQLISLKNGVNLQTAQIARDSALGVASINAKGKVEVKQIGVDAKPNEISAQAEKDKEVVQAQEDAKQQAPFPAATGG